MKSNLEENNKEMKKVENTEEMPAYFEACVKAFYDARPPEFCWKPFLDTPSCTGNQAKSGGLCYEPCEVGRFGRKRKLWSTMCREDCGSTHVSGKFAFNDWCYLKDKNKEECINNHPNEKEACSEKKFFRKPMPAKPSATMFNKEKTECGKGYKRWGAICIAEKKVICPADMTSCGPLACAKDKNMCKKNLLRMIIKTSLGATELALFITSAGSGSLAAKGLEEFGKKIAEKMIEDAPSKLGFIMAEWAVMEGIDVYFADLKKREEIDEKIKKKDKKEDKTDQKKVKYGETYINRMISIAKENYKNSIATDANDKDISGVCKETAKGIVADLKRKKEANTLSNTLSEIGNTIARFDPSGMTKAFKECRERKKTGADCAKAVVELLSIVDITGILGIASAFIYPVCPTAKRM